MKPLKSEACPAPVIRARHASPLRGYALPRRGCTSALLLLTILITSPLYQSCDVVNQTSQAVNLANCQFRIRSVTDVMLVGVDVDHITSIKDLTWSDAQKLIVALTKPAMPLNFQVNIDARNPNATTAGLSSFDYIVFIDDIQITSGIFSQPISIPPNNAMASIPMNLSVDLKQALQGKSADAMLNFAMNLSGSGEKPSRIKVKIKPSILVNGQLLKYPGYITVKTEFSGAL